MALPAFSFGQSGQNEAEWNSNGWSVKKVVSNTSIQSGVNFSYTILFSAPAGTTSISIQDQVPPALEIVNVSGAGQVLGVNPVISWNNTTKLVTYNLSSLPSSGPVSGSFTIVVKFPEGVTCNGDGARNRVGIQVNNEWMWTPYVSTTAIAVDPWIVGKSIISGTVVNPNGGSCNYLVSPDDTITYRLYVTKANGYYGNVIGQQNASQAVVTDVLPAGAVMLPHPNATFSGNTITWNVNAPSQLLNAATPWAYYFIDVKVYYPAASFPVGTQILNSATLTATSCNQAVTHTSNQTCVKVENVVANPNAQFGKYLYLTNRVPGCTGFYYIVLCNNGNVPLTSFNIDDVIPAGITVNQVNIYNASATSPVTLNINNSPFITGITSPSYTTGNLTTAVNELQLQMTGSLPVGSCLYMYVYFTVDSNPTGTVVNNCATFAPLNNSLNLNPACVQFTVDEGAPQPCLLKDICSPQSDYEPGDLIRFRLRVQNIGSAPLSGAAIQDLLHSNFTYVGNESYYQSSNYNPACSSGGGIPAGTTAWSGVTPSHSGNDLSWNLPLIESECQNFYTANCGYYGTYGIPYYFIEFDARVDSFALPGVTPNSYSISGGNLTSPVTSNNVNVLVVASFGQEAYKLVSTDNGSTFATSGSVIPGNNARFRLNYRNLSNVAVSSIKMVDLLPKDAGSNDLLILNRSVSRGSQFDVAYVGNHASSLLPAGAAPTPTLQWASGQNICLPPYVVAPGCNATTWGSAPDQNILMDYGAGFLLPSSVNLREDFDVEIPATATSGQTVCNDFAVVASANFLLNGSPQSVVLTPIAAAPVCLTVGKPQESCCDNVKVEKVSGADGSECCVRIITTCEVKGIEVNVTNGTLAAASWNCSGALPNDYIGQTSYTFAPNGCVVDLTNCITPSQTGVTTVNYVIYFNNGEKCERSIKLECKPVESDCCALVDFKLSSKWPLLKGQTGYFHITNSNPSVPICYEDISASPSGNFTPGGLVIDGVPSSVPWSAVRIPASGNLTPGAVNSIDFHLTSPSYKGVITVCVVKCDGTKCCFEFKWNQKIIVDVGVDVDFNPVRPKLAAVSISPVVTGDVDGKIKYISFGLTDEEEAANREFGFWAVSAAPLGDEEYPDRLASISDAWMGKHHAFFELSPALKSDEHLGYFNLVFSPELPQLGATLFDEDGNIIYSGKIRVNGSDTITSIITPGAGSVTGNMFEFINLYPNPSGGAFRITYATGAPRDVEIMVVTATGQTITSRTSPDREAGIHQVEMSPANLSPGLYKVVLRSQGETLSKSLIIK